MSVPDRAQRPFEPVNVLLTAGAWGLAGAVVLPVVTLGAAFLSQWMFLACAGLVLAPVVGAMVGAWIGIAVAHVRARRSGRLTVWTIPAVLLSVVAPAMLAVQIFG